MCSTEFQDLCNDVHNKMLRLLTNNEEAAMSHCQRRDSQSLQELVEILVKDPILSDLKKTDLETAIKVSLTKISVPDSYIEQPSCTA